jgi:hypothetical protein
MEALKEFEHIVDNIYGVYLDGTTGFYRIRKWLEDTQSKALNILRKSHPELKIEFLEDKEFIYTEGDPMVHGVTALHRCTQAEIKERNSKTGRNYRFLGNMAVVALYQYWEDNYRALIAKELEVTKQDLNIDIMGDIRILRRSIIHHNGFALKDVAKCKILKWYKTGDEIFIDAEKFKIIVFYIKKSILSYCQ